MGKHLVTLFVLLLIATGSQGRKNTKTGREQRRERKLSDHGQHIKTAFPNISCEGVTVFPENIEDEPESE